MNECDPSEAKLVVKTAWPAETATDAPIGVPWSEKTTEPEVAGDTVAVSVTVALSDADEAGETPSVVVVDATAIEYDVALAVLELA